MQSQSLSSDRVRDSARFVATELLEEPVKEAVRDALREEATVVADEEAAATERATGQRSGESERQSSATEQRSESSGRSRRFWGGLLLAAVGAAYLARRRMQSSWSQESAGPQGTGYGSEGQLETSETSDRDVSPPEDRGPSPTTD